MSWRRIGFILLSGLCALLGCSDSPEPSQQANRPAPKPVDLTSLSFSDSTPESALREFLVALMARDADRLSRITVAQADVQSLMQRQPFPRPEIEMMRGAIRAMPFERLRVGQRVSHADDSLQRIDRERVNDSRLELLTPFHPEPFVLIKTENGWRIDPARLISSRIGPIAEPEPSADDGSAKVPNADMQ